MDLLRSLSGGEMVRSRYAGLYVSRRCSITFVLFCFSFVSLYHCVSQLHRISWPMIHFRHIWLSSILMNPHPHHLLWQLQSIFYSTPLYSIDDNCPPFPLPTLCDNDLYRRKSNDPKYQSTKIIFFGLHYYNYSWVQKGFRLIVLVAGYPQLSNMIKKKKKNFENKIFAAFSFSQPFFGRRTERSMDLQSFWAKWPQESSSCG